MLKTEQPAEAKAALEEPVEAKAVETMPPTTFRAPTLSYVLSRCAPPPTTLPLSIMAPEGLSPSLALPSATLPSTARSGAADRGVNHPASTNDSALCCAASAMERIDVSFFRVRRAPPPSPGEAYMLVEFHEGRPLNIHPA